MNKRALNTLILSVLILGLLLPLGMNAANEEATQPRSFLSSGITRLTSAISRFRSFLGGIQLSSPKERRRQELEARQSVLSSIVKFILEEIERADKQLEKLTLEKSLREKLRSELEENRIWFEGILGSIWDARVTSQVQTMADDVGQFRNHRHTILIRFIAALSLANRQEELIEVAHDRLSQIEDDLVILSGAGNNIESLREFLTQARKNIDSGEALLIEAQDNLGQLTPPFEESRYRELIDDIHERLSESNMLIRDAYRIFIDMVEMANNL